ncbi:usg protein [Azospirillum argentinense]|uniref:Usg family protein n=2 Tax=Azospirillum TaxID=191 RepID=A0A4D8PJP7_9PROT|nr:usg protein [Azospirillum argentinense]KAA1055410.1 Usg protein [Azospirillum argentinense]MBK3802516.1 Usg family protein [Azospirillum argentinense]QCN95675.1 Usg family protein [Azospirillum argentinense]QCO02790.1 Usg family protein [Azospirillum argentinense]
MASLGLQLRDYRLTTAEILYHMPDHPHLLQSYLWQELDLAPGYPVLRRFLDFWQANLDGKLHSVKLATHRLITPGEARAVAAEFRWN